MVPQVIARHVLFQPDAVVFTGIGKSPVTFRGLAKRIAAIGRILRLDGLSDEARVAVIVPSGIDLAVAILATTCHAVAVPLDPRLTGAEIDNVYRRLRIDAAIVLRGLPVPEAHDARSIGDGSDLGDLAIFAYGQRRRESSIEYGGQPDSIGVILRTSGTTAQPKLVPLTHRNIVARADRVQRRFALTPADRALGVAPLHYAQGIDVALFTPVLSGCSVGYPPSGPGHSPGDIMTWIDELKPTWLTAGPAFHINALERARERRDLAARSTLRVIESGGAPLNEQTRRGLQEIFHVPVLETYGSSEAGPMSSNGWDLAERKDNTLGKHDDGVLAVCDDEGRILGAGAHGEIITRGPTVAPGYFDADGVLRPYLIDGWFRTGDTGSIDEEGFLTVAGRINDVINRGGEKVGPAEIDRMLLSHPDVLEAAAFSVPHRRLGEDVYAAVVVRPGATITQHQLRDHVKERLAPYKVPRRIHLVSELPHGSTGKIARGELTMRFSVALEAVPTRPRSALEVEIVGLWARLLSQETVDPNADFFDLGGDSLLAVQMLMELETVVGRELSEALLFEAATPRQLAEAIVAGYGTPEQLLVPLRPAGEKAPFLYFDGDFAGGGYYARRFANVISDDRPVWLLRPFEGVSGEVPTMELMAKHYLTEIRAAGMKPPYLFGGHCNGALMALAVAHEAEAAGESVGLVVLVDAISLNARRPLRIAARTIERLTNTVVRGSGRRDRAFRRTMTLVWDLVRAPRYTIARVWTRQSTNRLKITEADSMIALPTGDAELDRRYAMRMSAYYRTMSRFVPKRLSADIVAYGAVESTRRMCEPELWRSFGTHFESATVPGGHLTCISDYFPPLGRKIATVLERYG